MALALLCAMNIAMPIAAARPHFSPDTSDTAFPGDASDSDSGILMRPMAYAPIKTEYSTNDVLKAVASGASPFTNFAESVNDAIAVSTGRDIPAQTRGQLRETMQVLDYGTGVMSKVQLLRLPADVAQLVSEQIAGRPPDVSRVISVLLNSDLRGLDTPGQPRRQTDTTVHHRAIAHKANAAQGLPVAAFDEMAKWRTAPKLRKPNQPNAASTSTIHGEREFLQDYSQWPLGMGPLTELRHGLVLMGGQFFLRRPHGFYRLQRSKVRNHWLVDAPTPGKPQVPIKLDPATGEWHAYAPLRLCGGGCSQSRMGAPQLVADSVYSYEFDLDGIIDTRVRDAIRDAFDALGDLNLLRSNRQDMRPFRNNSISEIRKHLWTRQREIDPSEPLDRQQRRAASMTANFYIDNPGREAFCHENAEILLHFMLVHDVPKSRLRMVTLRPQNRPAHVMVLYTESPLVIKALDLATPQPPIEGQVDGLTHQEFSKAILSTRDHTWLFDPWSRIKMVTFERARSVQDVSDTLAPTLEAAGYRRSEPYRISVTRTLSTPANERGAQLNRDRS